MITYYKIRGEEFKVWIKWGEAHGSSFHIPGLWSAKHHRAESVGPTRIKAQIHCHWLRSVLLWAQEIKGHEQVLLFCCYSYQLDSNAKERHSEKPVLSHIGCEGLFSRKSLNNQSALSLALNRSLEHKEPDTQLAWYFLIYMRHWTQSPLLPFPHTKTRDLSESHSGALWKDSYQDYKIEEAFISR